ncbi:hypothetical protein [Herbaspirillum huttiense]|uniref:hypothetical protein n=1 Tax=Herbaspirillum huttiense TaxID=863372 RepID=UPI0039AFA228
MIGPIHAAVKAGLDAKSYAARTYPTGTSISVIKGGPTGVRPLNPVYELSYKPVPVSSATINVYCRTGSDGYQHLAGFGEVVVRTFDTGKRDFNADRTVVYTDANYCVYELLAWSINGSIWLFTHERLRSNPTSTASARNCVMVSTDGLQGKAFAPAVVCSFSNYVIPSSVLTNNDGASSVVYGGAGTSPGIYKALVNTTYDGTLSSFSQVSTNIASEGSYLNMDTAGTVIGVYRTDTGAPLRMTRSTNWGSSWSGYANTIGASAGAKVTPKLIRCAGDASRVIVSFNDRGSGNFDYISSLNADAGLAANSLRAPARLSDLAISNGNGSICALSASDRSYLCIAASLMGNNAANNMIWWIFCDSVNVAPAPWQ